MAERKKLIREENKRTSHRYAEKDERTLLNRMEKYSHNHLLFLHDFSSVRRQHFRTESKKSQEPSENGNDRKHKKTFHGHRRITVLSDWKAGGEC